MSARKNRKDTRKKINKERPMGQDTIDMIKEMHELTKMMISIRLSRADYLAIREKCKLYSVGNLSKWMVYTAKKYQPTQEELIKIQPKKKIIL